jgi:predicted hotdog family 3-hydroxylacyl-ACP dehydratase
MVFLDEVTAWSEQSLTARYTPPTDHWIAARGLPSYIGIEIIAQAIAAHNSLLSRKTDPTAAPSIGVLLGTRRYLANLSSFPTGQAITVTVEEKVQDPQGFGAFEGKLLDDQGRPLAQATVKVFRPANFRDYIATQRPITTSQVISGNGGHV